MTALSRAVLTVECHPVPSTVLGEHTLLILLGEAASRHLLSPFQALRSVLVCVLVNKRPERT